MKGVKGYSEINNVDNFHGTNNFHFDIFHDVLEDHGNFALKLVISKIVLNKNYSLSVAKLNNRIKIFKYGRPEISNKPSSNITIQSLRKVSTEHKLKQNGA